MHSERLSVVIPLYNEVNTIDELLSRLRKALSELQTDYEIVVVDDGSKDGSGDALLTHAKNERHLQVVLFKSNFGQTAALAAGIEKATGNIIVTIDSDLENDPADIGKLLKKMDEGYDVVSGWRQGRWKGAWLSRKLPSILANAMISYLTGVKLHDYGCTLKAYRADIIKSVNLYGEMHRFIPAYAAWQGGRVVEVPVSHSPRKHGKSHYGFGRVFRVLLDLVVVVFMHRYMNRPMHFFGMWGLFSLFIGFLSGVGAVVLKLLHLRDFIATPLPVLTALFIIVGIQLVMFGVIGEMLMRTYYESQNRRPYVIKETAGQL
jgi:glycosyltransferase involved in cell wall biosynthesis